MNIEPFTHIVKAFKYIEEQSADQNKTKVNIYLLAGDHFMTTGLYRVSLPAYQK